MLYLVSKAAVLQKGMHLECVNAGTASDLISHCLRVLKNAIYIFAEYAIFYSMQFYYDNAATTGNITLKCIVDDILCYNFLAITHYFTKLTSAGGGSIF